MQEYFYAILSGKLVVEICDESTEIISAESFPSLGTSATDDLVGLAKWAVLNPQLIEISAPQPDGIQSLTGDHFPEELCKQIRGEIESGKPFGVKLNLKIHPIDSEPLPASFCVYMKANSFSDKITWIEDAVRIFSRKYQIASLWQEFRGGE